MKICVIHLIFFSKILKVGSKIALQLAINMATDYYEFLKLKLKQQQYIMVLALHGLVFSFSSHIFTLCFFKPSSFKELSTSGRI